MAIKLPSFRTIHGVDFSGAAQAGRNIWVATCVPVGRRLELIDLRSLESLASTADRDGALAHLVRMIRDSSHSLWAIDFPFGLPIELFDSTCTWKDQLEVVRAAPDSAPQFGRWCVQRSRQRCNGRLHVRRATDVEQRTPFDCYHYRIIYQTFHGMRDVLRALAQAPHLSVLPFQYRKLATASTVVVEACPSSTLKRLNLPHQNYKQPAGGALVARRCRVRRKILESLAELIGMSKRFQRLIMRNPGGDALDAVVAAVGTHWALRTADHAAISAHSRYPAEGFVFA